MNSAVIRTCERIGLVLGIVAVLTSIVLQFDWTTTAGVGLGAALALGNLVMIRKIVSRLLSAGQDPDSGKLGMGAVVMFGKLGLLLVAVFVIIKVIGASPSAFMVGVTAVFAAVIVASFVMALQSPDALTADGDSASGGSGSG